MGGPAGGDHSVGVVVQEAHSEEMFMEPRPTADRREQTVRVGRAGAADHSTGRGLIYSPPGAVACPLQSQACLLQCVLSGLKSHMRGLSPSELKHFLPPNKCYQLDHRQTAGQGILRR